MSGLRDTIEVLWPATKTDTYTEDPVVDWDTTPVRTIPARANVQPVSSSERTVTEDTIVARWDCWTTPDVDVAASCRVRWDGGVYLIDGDVERWKTGRRVRRIHLLLKKVT